MKFTILSILGVSAFHISGVSADTHSTCSNSLGACVCSGEECPSFTSDWSTTSTDVLPNGVTVCAASKSGDATMSIEGGDTTVTVDGKTYQTPFESCDEASSSAGMIVMGMGYVWFAAAAAFAGIN